LAGIYPPLIYPRLVQGCANFGTSSSARARLLLQAVGLERMGTPAALAGSFESARLAEHCQDQILLQENRFESERAFADWVRSAGADAPDEPLPGCRAAGRQLCRDQCRRRAVWHGQE